MSMMRQTRIGMAALAAALGLAGAASGRVSITMNTGQVFGTIDPAKIKDYTDYMAAVNLYEGLTTVGAHGEPLPLLADHWEISPDHRIYTFHLAKGVAFQNGRPLEAADVVWSIQRLLALGQGPAFIVAGLLSPGGIRAPNASTVEIRLERAFAPFLASTPLLFVLDRKEVEASAGPKDTWGEAYVGSHAVGSGPYKLGQWERGGTMVLERNTAYHGGFGDRPIDEVRLIITLSDATVKAMIARGELQMTSDIQADETYKSIAKQPGYRVTRTPTATALYIKLNHKVAPTDDVHVRRAIAYALDYATIRELIYPGEPLQGALPAAFAEPQDPTLPAAKYDLALAAAELKQSRYAGRGKIPLDHMIVAETQFEEDIALLLKSTLDSIGFDVKISSAPWSRIVELASRPETTPASTQISISPAYAAPDSLLYPQYDSHAAGTFSSMSWLQNPGIDGLIETAQKELDPEKQRGFYKQVQHKLVDDQTDVFVLAQIERHGMSRCLDGYQYYPIQSFSYNFSKLRWTCH